MKDFGIIAVKALGVGVVCGIGLDLLFRWIG